MLGYHLFGVFGSIEYANCCSYSIIVVVHISIPIYSCFSMMLIGKSSKTTKKENNNLSLQEYILEIWTDAFSLLYTFLCLFNSAPFLSLNI